MKIYGNPLSPNDKRVLIAAAELGLPAEHVVLDVRGGANRTPEYLAKNPMGKIPTFEDDDGWVLWESTAIICYLGEKHADKGLFPVGLRERADALRWLFWNSSHLEPAGYRLFGQKVLRPMRGGSPDESVVAEAHKDLDRYLPVLEARLGDREFVLGPFTLVDVCLGVPASLLRSAQLGVDLSAYPRVTAWLDRLAARPAWKLPA